MITKETVKKLSSKSDCYYLYDEQGIDAAISLLKEKFVGIDFLYSVKCNPHPEVVNRVLHSGFGSDAASLNEVLISAEAGLEKSKIFYSAPGKTPEDIEQAITKSVLIADSLNEVKLIEQIAEKNNISANIGLRINPNFSFAGDKGSPSKFGVDEDTALEFVKILHNKGNKNIKITGIHVHLKSQELNAETLRLYYDKMFALAEKFKEIGLNLEFLNMGSGMGVPYSADDAALDVDFLGKYVSGRVAEFKKNNPNTSVIIETGRYIVCKSGIYVTKVLDKKTSFGKTFIILKNTLNGFVRPSLTQLVEKYARQEYPAATEPLYTGKNSFGFYTLKNNDTEKKETVSLVGNLCTGADIIAENISLPKLEIGDNVIISNAGAYRAVLSPMQFSSQIPPKQFYQTATGEIKE